MSLDSIKKVFYSLVEDAKVGFSLNVYGDDFNFIRFNYIENGRISGNVTNEEYYGIDSAINEIYDAEYSNGTKDYLPTLVVNNKEEFFISLYNLVQRYYDFYNFYKTMNYFEEDSVVKNIIVTILSNARYVDYENPIDYFNRYMSYFDNSLEEVSSSEEISILDNSIINTFNSREEYGYETPYCFKMNITNGVDTYNLPVINYGISNNTCYIYSIQNKIKNEDNGYCKKIKRLLNKVNANVINDSDYENSDTILGVTPSFVLTMSLFMKILKNNNIDNVEIITFLPDRYLEKKATEEYDADSIQHNLTEKMVLLFYRLKYHIEDMDISYPIYDGIINDNDKGENLVVKLGDSIDCGNNDLLSEVLNGLKKSSKKI